MSSFLRRLRVPHVYTLLTAIVLVGALATWFVPSGEYQRESRVIEGHERTVVVPGTYRPIPKNRSLRAALIGDEVEGESSPVGLHGFLTAIPRGLEAAADIIFFIFVIGGVFGIFQRTGMITALIQGLMSRVGHSPTTMTVLVMVVIGIGGSTLGMGEEFIPLVPIFLLISKRLGYDRIYGLALVILAAQMGFAAATTNPFTVNVAQGIAEIPLSSGLWFRAVFFVFAMGLTILHVLRYGARLRRDPAASLMPEDDFDLSHHDFEEGGLDGRQIASIAVCIALFGLVLYAVTAWDWWLSDMAGGFLLMGIAAAALNRLSPRDATLAFAKGTEEMVVAALVVGFARAIQVVLTDGMVLDTLIYSAATVLAAVPRWLSVQGMLVFQTTFNFFVPSGSGQAAVTMPLMAPLADVLGITRQTAVFAFQCGDGFSNTLIPTSGILMSMLALAKIPYEKWLRFALPLFGQLMVLAGVFLAVAVAIGYR